MQDVRATNVQISLEQPIPQDVVGDLAKLLFRKRLKDYCTTHLGEDV